MVGGRPFAVSPGGRRCGHLGAGRLRPVRRPASPGRAGPGRCRCGVRHAARAGAGRSAWRRGGRQQELAPQGDAAAARQLRAVVDNAEEIGVRDFGLRYVDEASAASADGTWSAAVDVTWRFARFDEAASRSEVTVRFRGDGDRVGVVGIGGGDLRTPIWMSGPVTVRRSPDTLVVDAGPASRAAEYDRRARTAVADVRAVLPQWQTGLVVEVPQDAAGLDAALDAEPGTYAGIAAVTSSTDGSSAPDTPIHVFLNPDIYDRLGRTGAQVVMSHEAVHVATDAPNSSMPQWLLEGLRRLCRAARRRPSVLGDGRADHQAGTPGRRPRRAAGAGGVRQHRHAPRGGVRERLAGLPGAGRPRRRGRPGRASTRRWTTAPS